jgi:hypothetical protein
MIGGRTQMSEHTHIPVGVGRGKKNSLEKIGS